MLGSGLRVVLFYITANGCTDASSIHETVVRSTMFCEFRIILNSNELGTHQCLWLLFLFGVAVLPDRTSAIVKEK